MLKNMDKTGGGEGVYIQSPHADHTQWQGGPSPKVESCFGNPGLVIEQYALLCSMRFHLLMLCMCFISPFTKEEALQTATFTLLLAALLNELKHLSIHMWKYTTHTQKKKIRVMVSVQSFLLTVKRKNVHKVRRTEIFL